MFYVDIQFLYTNITFSTNFHVFEISSNISINGLPPYQLSFQSLNTHFMPSTWPSLGNLYMLKGSQCGSSEQSSAVFSLSLSNQVTIYRFSFLSYRTLCLFVDSYTRRDFRSISKKTKPQSISYIRLHGKTIITKMP